MNYAASGISPGANPIVRRIKLLPNSGFTIDPRQAVVTVCYDRSGINVAAGGSDRLWNSRADLSGAEAPARSERRSIKESFRRPQRV